MKNNHIYTKIVLLPACVLILFLASCSKDPIREKQTNPEDTTTISTYENGIFLVNEGNFNWGNASVTYLNNSTNTVVQDIFAKSNNRSLGDVAESMAISGDMGYVVMNNSNRIEVVSVKDFKSAGTITGLHSPRFFRAVDSSKAYVTNLQNFISVIDLKTKTVTGSIPTTSWTENLIRYNRFMLVTSVGRFSEPSSKRKAQILVIDTQTDAIVDSIQSGKEPIGLVIDKKQKVWVLCSGGYDNFEPPSLIRINPELRLIEKAFSFPHSTAVPSRLCINPAGDTLYFLKGGVFQMSVQSTSIPSKPLIPADGRNFYGLDIHPNTGNVYVTDAKDYVQNGTAYQYNSRGQLIRQYSAGRIPGSFCFTRGSAK